MRRWAAGLSVVTATFALAASCAPDRPAPISRDAFVETYTALRAAELRSSGAVIPDQARDSVLAEMGVSEEDLAAFAEAHGDDMAFMEAVWSEVQSRLTELSGRP